jgi:hypothetical protein
MTEPTSICLKSIKILPLGYRIQKEYLQTVRSKRTLSTEGTRLNLIYLDKGYYFHDCFDSSFRAPFILFVSPFFLLIAARYGGN